MIYTQEPWEIQNGSTGPYIIAKEGNGNHVAIAQVFPRGIAGCETKGNARLVKAAPKMYEALLEICRTYRIEPDGKPENWDARGQHGWAIVLKALAEVEGGE